MKSLKARLTAEFIATFINPFQYYNYTKSKKVK